MRGRRPVPDEILLLRGTKRRVKSLVPSPDPVGPDADRPPKALDAAGRKFWRAVVPALRRRGALADTDLAALYLAADLWSLYTRTRAAIAQEGATYVCTTKSGGRMIRQHPQAGLLIQTVRVLLSAFSALGMTPADRARLRLTVGSEPDPTEAYLLQGKPPAVTTAESPAARGEDEDA